MYVFLVFALPLAFLLLAFAVYPREEIGATQRAVVRGLVMAVPVWFLSRLVGSLMPTFWGSALLGLHEWADRFLPYSIFPALAYGVFYHFNKRLSPGEEERRMTAFFAGCISPFGIGEMTRIWGNPDLYSVMVLPFLLAAVILSVPRFLIAFAGEYGARRSLPALALAFCSLAASCVRSLFVVQLWPLGLLLAAGAVAGAWFFSLPGLLRKAPQPLPGEA